jgi:hypothetical protein
MGAARELLGGGGPVGGPEAGPALHPFLVTPEPAFGRPACRLGLASYGDSAVTPDDVLYALRRGVNFLNWARPAEGPPAGSA